jgi:hypothetical protein
MGMQISITTKEISMEVPRKIENRPNDPALPLLGIYIKDCKSIYNRNTCTPMFTAALLTIAKLWNQPRYPTTDEWVKKIWNIYTMEKF